MNSQGKSFVFMKNFTNYYMRIWNYKDENQLKYVIKRKYSKYRLNLQISPIYCALIPLGNFT